MATGVVVCSDDTSIPLGQHKHKCDCGTTWFHNMSERDLQTTLSSEEYANAHCCPSCGNNVRERFFANEQEREACHAEICAMLEDIDPIAAFIEMLLADISKHRREFI